MQVTRKIAAAAAVATVATLGLATVVSANMLDGATQGTDLANQASAVSKGYGHGGDKVWYFVKRDGGLVGVDNNNVGPFQACDNKVALAGIGGAVNADDVLAIVGIDSAGHSATAVKTCEQDTKQSNSNKWYKVGGDLVSVSNNNVGPFQACHNDLAIAGIGLAGNVDSIGALLGLGSQGAAIDSLRTCEQETVQNN
jgi:hypothetical protein